MTVSRDGKVFWQMANKTDGDPRLLERRMMVKLAELLTDASQAEALSSRREPSGGCP
ncbi:MAG: hypothetical protein M1401_11555 [Chloroflexi bacterium]|nr:hypothetical protein [Chloroflexota bacterium]MCL5109480.1 hypothetical protein [Chloroflexota bacterium]